MRRNYVAPLAIILACGMLSACNTEEELLKQKLKVLEAEEKALVGIQQTLKDIQGLEAWRVSIFLSEDLLNSVLAGRQYRHPCTWRRRCNRPGSLHEGRLQSWAATRERGSSRSEEGPGCLSGSCWGCPDRNPGDRGCPTAAAASSSSRQPCTSRQMGLFDFKLGGFARDLMQVKITDELRKVGEITIPIETKIPLSIPAKETPIAFTGVKGVVATLHYPSPVRQRSRRSFLCLTGSTFTGRSPPKEGLSDETRIHDCSGHQRGHRCACGTSRRHRRQRGRCS